MNTGLILMFVALAVCLLIGVPVAFSIGISCMTLLYVNGGPSMDILLQRMVSGAKSFNMLAMPMFIFAGALMVYGSTPRLIKLANMLLRKFPGGLGATAMAACGFFGAVSGSGVASAAAIGKIIGPSMLEEGYPKGLTAGLIAAGGTMACIIPPSMARRFVSSLSSGLGVTSPLGWLCSKRKLTAPTRSACRKISRGETSAASMVPIERSFSLIRQPLPSSNSRIVRSSIPPSSSNIGLQ